LAAAITRLNADRPLLAEMRTGELDAVLVGVHPDRVEAAAPAALPQARGSEQ
jgi:hypothetical protein